MKGPFQLGINVFKNFKKFNFKINFKPYILVHAIAKHEKIYIYNCEII